jgi:signal peptidase II
MNKSEFQLSSILGWGLLLGGTVGNLIDRLFASRVTDFIDFTLINFPVFNIADISINIGAFIIILLSLKCPGNNPNETK